MGDLGSISGSERCPGDPLQYPCLKESHGQRSLMGYSPWSHKELDMAEWLTHTNTHHTKNTGSKIEINKWDYIKLKNFCTAKKQSIKRKGKLWKEKLTANKGLLYVSWSEFLFILYCLQFIYFCCCWVQDSYLSTVLQFSGISSNIIASSSLLSSSGDSIMLCYILLW